MVGDVNNNSSSCCIIFVTNERSGFLVQSLNNVWTGEVYDITFPRANTVGFKIVNNNGNLYLFRCTPK